jgi:flagellar basal-body rod protein FlgB
MDLDRVDLLKAITRRMEWLGERQRVLSENIANADTPGYQARDLKQVSFGDLVKGAQPGLTARVTQPDHIAGLSGQENDRWATKRLNDAYETAPNGNKVDLEQQMMSVTETQADHNLMTNLYRKQMSLLRKAIGGGGQGG